MKLSNVSIEKVLTVLGPVRFITFLLFPFLLTMCAYAYSIDQSIDDYVLNLMLFCLFINDIVINHWSSCTSYYQQIFEGPKNVAIPRADLTNIRAVKFVKKGEFKDPKWISPFMMKVRRDNQRFLYVLFALVMLSITMDYIPGKFRDWIMFFLSTFWSYLLVREIQAQSKNTPLNKKFMVLCYNLAFIVFVFGVLIIQN